MCCARRRYDGVLVGGLIRTVSVGFAIVGAALESVGQANKKQRRSGCVNEDNEENQQAG